MATVTNKKATFSGFSVVCPACGANEDDATITLNVNQLDAYDCMHCSNCDWEGSPGEAVAMMTTKLQRWQKLARWVELAGELAGDEPAV
jgi:hypothetical protein